MPHLMLKDLPRYECLMKAAQSFPELDPSATEAFLHLLRAGDEAFRIAETNLAKFGITSGRFGVLMALWSHGQRVQGPDEPTLTPAELAERTGVTRATITGLIDTLERDGLVLRTPRQDDRRTLSVGLTAFGRSALVAIIPGHFRRMAWLMEPLSEEERGVLVRLLQKVTNRAGEEPMPPVPTAGVGLDSASTESGASAPAGEPATY